MPIINALPLLGRVPVLINGAEVSRFLTPYLGGLKLAVIESVGAMPKQGLSSTFRFGEGYGLVQGILAGLGVTRTIKATPQVWKASMGVTANKDTSLTLAKNLFPTNAHLFARKKDHGRAEALLLAVFGARSLGWEINSSGEKKIHDLL